MKRLTACFVLVLAACQSTAEQPNQSTVLSGDYRTVSDCFYRAVATSPGYQKVEAPSSRTVTVKGSSAGGSADQIDFISAGEGITNVRAQLGVPGSDKAWSRYMDVLKQCEEP